MALHIICLPWPPCACYHSSSPVQMRCWRYTLAALQSPQLFAFYIIPVISVCTLSALLKTFHLQLSQREASGIIHTHIFLRSTLTFIMKPVKVKAMFPLPGKKKKGDEISDKCSSRSSWSLNKLSSQQWSEMPFFEIWVTESDMNLNKNNTEVYKYRS